MVTNICTANEPYNTRTVGEIHTPATPIVLESGAGIVTFTATAPAPFLMLHFRVEIDLPAGANIRVTQGGGPSLESFDSTDGGDFWTRPIRGNLASAPTVDIEYLGAAGGRVVLEEYGMGTSLNLFMLSGAPFNTPATTFNTDNNHHPCGLCPKAVTTTPAWEDAASITGTNASMMMGSAAGIGMMIYKKQDASGLKLLTGTATYIGDTFYGESLGDPCIITAAHCVNTLSWINFVGNQWEKAAQGMQIESGSITFDYMTDASGNIPAGYNPRFYKLKRLVKWGFGVDRYHPYDDTPDYAIIALEEVPAAGIPVVQPVVIPTGTGANEDANFPEINPADPDADPSDHIFLAHFPRAHPKKISRRRTTAPLQDALSTLPYPGTESQFIYFDADQDRGSSGAPVLNVQGGQTRILGVLKAYLYLPYCESFGWKMTRIRENFLIPAAVLDQRTADVMLVIDRSGSMGRMEGALSKLDHAQDAVDLFLTLLQGTTGNQVGMVSFSTTVVNPSTTPGNALSNPLEAFTEPEGTPNSQVRSRVNGLSPDSMTNLREGLVVGYNQLPTTDTQPKLILLLSDGVQNISPLLQHTQVGTLFPDSIINVLGYGSDWDLDEALLNHIADANNGFYIQSTDSNELRKFFVQSFGNIFRTGVAADPPITISGGSQTPSEPLPTVYVEQETQITVVIGWQRVDAEFDIRLIAPDGTQVDTTAAGVREASGRTWHFIEVNLPYGARALRQGEWRVEVTRLDTEPLSLNGHNGQVRRLVFHPDGLRALSAAAPNDVMLWDLEAGSGDRPFLYIGQFGTSAELNTVDIHQDGQLALTVFNDSDEIILWNFDTYELVNTFSTGYGETESEITAAEFSPDGQFILVVSREILSVFNSSGDSTPVMTTSIPDSDIMCATWSNDSTRIAVGIREFTGDEQIEDSLVILDLDGEQILKQFIPATIFDVKFSVDDAYVFAATPTQVHIINASTGETADQLDISSASEDETSRNIERLAVDPTGVSLVVGYRQRFFEGTPEGYIGVWDVRNLDQSIGSERFILLKEENFTGITSVDFSNTGSQLLSGAWSGSGLLWNVIRGEDGQVSDLEIAWGPLHFAEEIFFSAVVDGGPVLTVPTAREPRYYTGDPLNPQIILREPEGWLVPATVILEITRPTDAVGELLSEQGLAQEPLVVGQDTFNLRSSTLYQLKQRQEERDQPLIATVTETYELFDDSLHYDGAQEPDGIFGNLFADVTQYEGNYQFRAVATFGRSQRVTREVTWSSYIEVGIDPDQTDVSIINPTDNPDGTQDVIIRFCPKDTYGRRMGPGRANTFTIKPLDGVTLTGELVDLGDGCYEQPAKWEPASDNEPGIIIEQPRRDEVVLTPDDDKGDGSETDSVDPDPSPDTPTDPDLVTRLTLVGLIAAATAWLFKRDRNALDWLILAIILLLILFLIWNLFRVQT